MTQRESDECENCCEPNPCVSVQKNLLNYCIKQYDEREEISTTYEILFTNTSDKCIKKLTCTDTLFGGSFNCEWACVQLCFVKAHTCDDNLTIACDEEVNRGKLLKDCSYLPPCSISRLILTIKAKFECNMQKASIRNSIIVNGKIKRKQKCEHGKYLDILPIYVLTDFIDVNAIVVV